MTQDRDDRKRAVDEAEFLLASLRMEEERHYDVELLGREAQAILEILTHVKALQLADSLLGSGDLSQTEKDSTAALIHRLQSSKTGRDFTGPVRIEASYSEINGFSRQLEQYFPRVVSMAKVFGSSEPSIYVAQMPLILNEVMIAAGGKDNLDLRRTWEPYIHPDQS